MLVLLVTFVITVKLGLIVIRVTPARVVMHLVSCAILLRSVLVVTHAILVMGHVTRVRYAWRVKIFTVLLEDRDGLY